MIRPKTRGECPPPGEPCPFVSCRHHLLIEVATNNTGSRPDLAKKRVSTPAAAVQHATCACGCGGELPVHPAAGRPRRWLDGHKIVERKKPPAIRLNVIGNGNGRRRGLDAYAKPAEVDMWTDAAVDRLFEMKETCALRASSAGGMSDVEIAEVLGTTKQAISAELVAVQDKLRARGDLADLEELFRSR